MLPFISSQWMTRSARHRVGRIQHGAAARIDYRDSRHHPMDRLFVAEVMCFRGRSTVQRELFSPAAPLQQWNVFDAKRLADGNGMVCCRME